MIRIKICHIPQIHKCRKNVEVLIIYRVEVKLQKGRKEGREGGRKEGRERKKRKEKEGRKEGRKRRDKAHFLSTLQMQWSKIMGHYKGD